MVREVYHPQVAGFDQLPDCTEEIVPNSAKLGLGAHSIVLARTSCFFAPNCEVITNPVAVIDASRRNFLRVVLIIGIFLRFS